MRCYKCGNVLGSSDKCPSCGADVSVYKRIIYLSNIHYNEALDKVRTRNMTGARESLVKSLKYNKRNIQSRNLLGLVYYGLGRISEALVEWVISSNIQPEDNIATEYVKYFQEKEDELEEMNTVLRKYNECVEHIRKGNEDLAFLHMRKIMNLKPKLPECFQLMAIMCIRNRQPSAAAKYLKTALSLDMGNKRTLELIDLMDQGISSQAKEIDHSRNPISGVKKKHSFIYKNGNDIIIQPRRGSKIKATADIITAGKVGGTLLIIAAVIWFLFVPAHVRKLTSQANDTIREYNIQNKTIEENMNSMKSELDAYKAKEKAQEASSQVELGLIDSYEALIELQRKYHNDTYDSVETMTTLINIDKSKLGESGQSVYDNLWNELADIALEKLYEKGCNNEDWGEYEAAAGYFEQVIAIQEDYDDSGALYHAGCCHEKSQNGMKARTYFERVLNDHADSGYASSAREHLDAINGNSTVSDEDSDENN